MLMKEYCFIDDYIISNYICFMFLKAISEADSVQSSIENVSVFVSRYI